MSIATMHWIAPTLLLSTQPLAEPAMTGASWAFMLAAWVGVGGMAIWCFWRVLGGGRKA